MAEQAGAEFDVDAAGGVGEEVGAQRREEALEEVDGDQADADHGEGGVALVHQHFVHHHLEEERGDEGEELEEEGGDQDFAEQPPVFDDGGDEPGEVEAGEFGGERGARGQQNERAVPAGEEVGFRQDLGPAAGGVLDEDAALGRGGGAEGIVAGVGAAVDAGEDEEVAVTVAGDGRQWSGGEGLWPEAAVFGFESELLGGEQQGGEGKTAIRCAMAMQERLRVRRHAMQPRQHRQTRQPGGRLKGVHDSGPGIYNSETISYSGCLGRYSVTN